MTRRMAPSRWLHRGPLERTQRVRGMRASMQPRTLTLPLGEPIVAADHLQCLTSNTANAAASTRVNERDAFGKLRPCQPAAGTKEYLEALEDKRAIKVPVPPPLV
jgi:hypothetical protein